MLAHPQWRIQDFPQRGAPTPEITIIFQIFAENCMKMKDFGPPGGHASLAPLLDPPMHPQWKLVYPPQEMHTALMETIHASVSVATTRVSQRGVGYPRGGTLAIPWCMWYTYPLWTDTTRAYENITRN